jgi:F0F1-type ATP synthase gamma subunit
MDPNSNERKIWRKLDQYSRFHDRREIKDLSEEEIKKTLACAQLSDRGRAGAYIAGEELLKEIEKSKEKDEKKKKTYRWIMIGAAGVVLAFLIYLFLRFFFFF